MKSVIRFFYVAVVALLFQGCTALKLVPENEKLYTGHELNLISVEKIKDKKRLENAAEEVIRPKPNSKILGMRPGLWIWYKTETEKKKGLRYFINKKLGQPPVYLSKVTPAQTSKYIDAALFNRGVFKAVTAYESKEKKKTAGIIYNSNVHRPFTIDKVTWPSDSSALSNAVGIIKKGTLLKQGDPYSLDILRRERERIDLAIKDKGFFYFHPEYILFLVDTQEINNTVNYSVTFKNDMPERAGVIYAIGDVYIDQTYTLRADSLTVQKDTVNKRGVYFIGENPIRPKVIRRSVFLRSGEIYSSKNHNMSLSRLMSMGNFKFVTIDFPERDTTRGGLLDVKLALTPSSKRTARVETQLATKSNDFVGPALNITYKNRNTLNGAELLSLNLTGGFETQISGKYKGLFSYNINPEVELFIPRFIVPFKIKQPRSYYIPLTRFAVGYEFMKRVGFYNLESFEFSAGYKWKENIKSDHELNPIAITYSVVSNKSPEFESLIADNPLLGTTFEEQFIPGMNYTYTFNEQVIPQKSQFYVQGKAEFAGNTLSLINQLSQDRKPDPDNPFELSGAPYSQFARISGDFRNYFNFTKDEKIVLRIYAGAGIPYGNSSVLPYSKQFFSGGPNSIRAFRINSLGPGTYLSPADEQGRIFFSQGGELKGEANAEYRFGIYKIFKGAVFVDAGNVWLLNTNPSIDAKPFAWGRFANELAVGTGLGLRVDVTFFVLRLDLAFPLRKPWYPAGEQWVTDEIDFGSAGWRNENLLLNFAIGYPF